MDGDGCIMVHSCNWKHAFFQKQVLEKLIIISVSPYSRAYIQYFYLTMCVSWDQYFTSDQFMTNIVDFMPNTAILCHKTPITLVSTKKYSVNQTGHMKTSVVTELLTIFCKLFCLKINQYFMSNNLLYIFGSLLCN